MLTLELSKITSTYEYVLIIYEYIQYNMNTIKYSGHI